MKNSYLNESLSSKIKLKLWRHCLLPQVYFSPIEDEWREREEVERSGSNLSFSLGLCVGVGNE